MFILPSAIFVWVYGGLETPLLLFLISYILIISDKLGNLKIFDYKLLYFVFFLSGLAFLTRYDSVLFLLPFLIFLILKVPSKQILASVFIGSLLPLVWIILSYYYYGHIFPTSFYEKNPFHSLYVPHMTKNLNYIILNFFYIGIIPVFIILLALKKKIFYKSFNIPFKYLGVLCGLFFIFLYGLNIATTHMLFSFRFFVPYLPAVIFLMFIFFEPLYENSHSKITLKNDFKFIFCYFLILIFFVIQTLYTFLYSVNGFTTIGEYQSLGVRHYKVFMKTLNEEAQIIKRHWESTSNKKRRHPRIITYAAGMLPYTYKEAYIYSALISTRRNYINWGVKNNFGDSADYIHTLGKMDHKKALQKGLVHISTQFIWFDGKKQRFQIYYNPNPKAHTLSKYF